MDITYTEDERLLKEQARRFLEDACPPAAVRAAEQDWGAGLDLWRRAAALGWWAAALPVERGGSGYWMACLLAEEMGKNLLPGPVAETIALVSGLAAAGKAGELVDRLADGSAVGTLAVKEQAFTEWPDSEAAARPEGAGWRLSGRKHLAPYGAVADWALVTARADGRVRAFLVDLKGEGVRVEPVSTLGEDHRAEIHLGDAPVAAANVIEDPSGIVTRAAVARMAYLVGLGDAVLQLSTEYAKNRVQFGKPIGAFQAIQHRLADMAVEIQGARYITYQAASLVEKEDYNSPRVAMALAYTPEAVLDACMQGHQVHGAIGFTNEYDLQLFSRRARVWLPEYGTPDAQRERIARAESVGFR